MTTRPSASPALQWPDREPAGINAVDLDRLEALGPKLTDEDRAWALAGLRRRGADDLVPVLGLDNAPIRNSSRPKGCS